MNSNDKALAMYQTKFTAAYGTGAIPWPSILAALAAILGGCVSPTPANVKTQVARPVMHIKMYRRLRDAGVAANCIERVVAATSSTVQAATDDEINALVLAAQETE